jgi:steroid delta-isomerase-like uncharacterized protein
MTSDNNENVLQQMIEAENSHDLEKILALMTDDVIIEDVPFGMVNNGKDSVKQGFAALYNAIPNFKVEPKSWVTNDKSFALEAIFAGTQTGNLHGLPATAKGFSVRACSFGEFENGKIKGRRDYWDSASLEKQLLGEQK